MKMLLPLTKKILRNKIALKRLKCLLNIFHDFGSRDNLLGAMQNNWASIIGDLRGKDEQGAIK